MLSLTSKFGGFVVAAALAIGLAGAAPAATLSWSALPATNTANPLATTVSGTVQENVAGTAAAQRRSPWANNSPFVFTAVLAKSFAEYAFGSVQKSVSFVWGSPDLFNKVEFFRGGQLVDTIAGFGNGTNIALPTLLATNIDSGNGFDTIKFSSSGIAFEYGNLTLAPIPVPAAGLLLLTAVGGMAALRRRKSA
jgi:hypothetical protein